VIGRAGGRACATTGVDPGLQGAHVNQVQGLGPENGQPSDRLVVAVPFWPDGVR
jgi:hypothetical protein